MPVPNLHEPSTALPPHAPLTAYYGSEEQREAYLRRIFDATAPDYERIERLLAWGTGPWYRRQALQRAGLRPSASVDIVDVGIGTGLVAREALRVAGTGARLVGVDPSAGMMHEVKDPRIALRPGRAEALPLEGGSADFLSMGYALRHIADVAVAFREFHRVLRPGGRLVVLEISRPAGRLGTALLKGYMRALVPVIARFVGRAPDTSELWRYYWDTIEACIAPETVLAALRDAGFADVRRHVEFGIFSEYTATKAS